jgi:glucose/arabinose dehydrogenase/plastocyanin
MEALLRRAVGLGVAIAVTGVAGPGPVVIAAAPVASPPGTAIRVEAGDFYFAPDRLDVDPATSVAIQLVNVGAEPHNIAFRFAGDTSDELSDAVGAIVAPGKSDVLRLDLPGPGVYQFVCDVHPLDMSGTLVVRGAESSETPTSSPPVVGTPPSPDSLVLGPDPRIDHSEFMVTTYASGMPFPTSMVELADGSLLAAANVPAGGGFISSRGKLLRMVDQDGDGHADQIAPVGIVRPVGRSQLQVYVDLPGALIQMRRAAGLLILTSRQRGRTLIVVLREPPIPGDPFTWLGAVELAFPEEHLHDTYAIALRSGPTAGSTEVYFNVGSGLNAQADGSRIEASGLVNADLITGSIYRMTLIDDGEAVEVSDLRLVAMGLRNAAALAFDPDSGDLYLQDNGMESEDDPEEPINADELNVIAADRLGVGVPDFGFPDQYVAYRTGERVGTTAEMPVIAFQPIEGSEAQGAAEFTFAPLEFPAPFNEGIFIGFHGNYQLGGLANDENPVLWVEPDVSTMLEFIPNDAPQVGHPDSLLATHDSLYVADLSPAGDLNGPSPDGVIYRVSART